MEKGCHRSPSEATAMGENMGFQDSRLMLELENSNRVIYRVFSKPSVLDGA